MNIRLKRVYDIPEQADGYRVFVDRLWPRGLRKADFAFDLWAKELAPSPQARREFSHKAENFDAFKARYTMELADNPQAARIAAELARHETVTLLYAAKDRQVNHAIVLACWLESMGFATPGR